MSDAGSSGGGAETLPPTVPAHDSASATGNSAAADIQQPDAAAMDVTVPTPASAPALAASTPKAPRSTSPSPPPAKPSSSPPSSNGKPATSSASPTAAARPPSAANKASASSSASSAAAKTKPKPKLAESKQQPAKRSTNSSKDDDDDDDEEEEEEEEEEEDEDDFFEEEDDETGEMVRRKKHLTKRRRRGAERFFDVEVEVSSDEEVSEDEDEDDLIDDDTSLEGLIMDEDDDAEGDDDELKSKKQRSREAKKRRRKKSTKQRREEEALDEEDYNLIAENLGIQVRKSIDDDILDDDDDEERAGEGAGDGGEGGGGGGESKPQRKRLKKDNRVRSEDMFMPVIDDVRMEDASADRRKARRDNMNEDEKDRAFIDNSEDGSSGRRLKKRIDVDDDRDADLVDREVEEDEEDEDNERDDRHMDDEWGDETQPAREPKHRQTKLESLFGNVTSFLSENKLLGTKRGLVDEDDGDDEEDADEEERKARIRRKKVEQRERKKKTEAADPQRSVRVTDIPERMQARASRQAAFAALPVEQQTAEMRDEAEWIVKQMEQPVGGGVASDVVVAWVAGVLELLRVRHMELPYIFTYKQDVWSDQTGASLTEDELWLVDKLDAQWDMLQSRRRRLEVLLARVKVQDADVGGLVKAAVTSEELDDVQDYLRHALLVKRGRRFGSAATASADVEGKEAAEVDEAIARKSALVSRRRQEWTTIRAAVSSDLDAAATRLGLTVQQMRENLRLGYHLHLPVDTTYDLEETALQFIGKQYGSVQSAVDGMVNYNALLLSTDPLIRQQLRRLVWHHSVVSTKPTQRGKREVDDTHEYAHILHIDRKPVAAFTSNPAQFLLIGKALKEGYIELDVDVMRDEGRQAGEDPVLRQLTELYLSQAKTNDAERWNVHRLAVLTRAYQSLLSMCTVHVKGRLLRDGIDRVIRASEKRLYQHLTAGPFSPPPSLSGGRADQWKIISGCIGDTTSPACFVVLNRYGFVLDTLVLHFIKTRASARNRDGTQMSEGDRLSYARKKDDIQRLTLLIEKHRPPLVVLDASSMDVLALKDEIEQKCVIDSPDTRVELCDGELARVYMNSARSEVEFKTYDKWMRLAVSLGRRVLDPIAELCSTWSSPLANQQGGLLGALGLVGRETEGLKRAAVQASANPLANDLLALNLHPLQRQVPVQQLLRALERSLVRVVNRVGVDINRLTTRPWLTGVVQFICGLGPVKAQWFLSQVKRDGFVENRDSMLLRHSTAVEDGGEKGFFGPTVYGNCAGFIKIHRNSEMDTKRQVVDTPLDYTRIHPERYELAVQIAREALDITDEDEQEVEEDPEDEPLTSEEKEVLRQARDVRRLMESRERMSKLDNLDLAAFAMMEWEDRHIRILHTLQQIKAELITPFDCSTVLRPFTSQSPADLFTSLTGETARTLHDGMLITVTVQGFTARGVYVTLDGGLRGFLKTENVSSTAPTFDYKGAEERDRATKWLKARLAMNQALEVRVMKVEKDRLPYSVEVSSRTADRLQYQPLTTSNGLAASEEEQLYAKDQYSVPLPSAEQRHEEEMSQLRSEHKRRPFIARSIIHPLFRNCTRDEAIAQLTSLPVGECVIRPSSQGTDRLVVTWKVSDDMYGHVEVKESAKGANPLELGSELRIGQQQFEDVDEIIARFITPMCRHAQRMLEHKNFRLGDSAEIESILRVEKEQYPQKIPYAVSFSADEKGSFRSFMFSYLPSHTVRSERLTVEPRGFGFGGKTYKEPDMAIASLKHHIKTGGRKDEPIKPPPKPVVQPSMPLAAAPLAGYAPPLATSGYVHPARAGVVPGSVPLAGRYAPHYPPPPAAAAASGDVYGTVGRSSRWGQAPGMPMPQLPPHIPQPPMPPQQPYGVQLPAALYPMPYVPPQQPYPQLPPPAPATQAVSGFIHPSRQALRGQ